MHLESKNFGTNLSFFFLILHVLSYLRSVKCEMLGVSYLMVDRLLLIQMFGIPKNLFSHLWMCFFEVSKKYFVSYNCDICLYGLRYIFVQDLSCLMTGSRF